MKNLGHLLIVVFLTLITQIGGLLWILNFGVFRLKKSDKSKVTKLTTFISIYLFSTLLIVPQLAKFNNRIPLPIVKSGNLIPHNYITPLLNRNYVRPKLKSELIQIANQINTKNKNLKVSYLDGNFPFINGFPLLPHLSHNDGRKIDLTFFYTKDGKEGNHKASNSGYGKYVLPNANETNQTKICKSKGHWQYDFTKFVTLGGRDDLEFDSSNTKDLISLIIAEPSTQMVLIEPHLKRRMNLDNKKVRFHGCHAVRHDDHIHYQIKK